MQNPALAADEEFRAALELYRQGNRPAAERRCRLALGLVPEHRDSRILLGMILLLETRYEEAEVVFDELAGADPDQATHWINLGTARRGTKRFDAALVAYGRAAALGVSTADFFYNVGLTHVDRLDFEAGRAVFERAVALAPQDAEIRYRHAQACFETRRPEEALRSLAGWESLSDLTSEVAANLGTLLMNLGEATQANAAFARVTLDEHLEPTVALTVFEALERMNRLGEARVLLEFLSTHPRARSLGTDLLLAQAQLAERESRFDVACELRQRALEEVKEPHLRHFQLFRLAKCLDAAGRHEEAFAALEEAHRSQLAYFALTVPALSLRGVPTMTITRYGCDPADVAKWDESEAPSLDESPIFIVAFPRSGTTLLELTLDAHPQLKSMDEQPFLQAALHGLGLTGIKYPEQLAQVGNADLERIRAAYWERVGAKLRLEPGQRLVDKNPLNILRLPVIRRLFPHARVILSVRHPCDVLMSCFLQHFRSPDFALLCSDLGTLTTGYRRTMDYWYQQLDILEPAVREVRYETFVADFDTEVRGICEFLELPWDDRLLEPAAHARSKGYISTPSYSQVVQPVNQKAIGKWRAYQRHFEPVLPLLTPYFERWGYEA
jgi:tetratricopeptide (TPR) repeat protein